MRHHASRIRAAWYERVPSNWLLTLVWGIGLGGAILLLLLPSWLDFIDRPPLEYRNLPFPILNAPLRPGDTVLLEVDRCIPGEQPLPYVFTRQLVRVDGPEAITMALPSGGSIAMPGCELVQSRVTVLPADMPPGRYYLLAVTSVRGRWNTFSVPWRSAEFDVLPSDSQRVRPDA